LQLLGTREPGIYGTESLEDIVRRLKDRAGEWDIEIDSVQSNDEGDLVSRIGDSPDRYDGIILNPAAYTHTSIALRDALLAVDIPCVEVHLSNTSTREDFRHQSYTLGACIGQVMGFGADSYILALEGLVQHLRRKKA
jgi:3-dehydroquinate dehydratase-2